MPSEDSSSRPTDALIAALYDDLRVIAGREHRRAGAPDTLRATALIGEAYLKLAARDRWASREHFLGHAATAIRHILIDAARARLTSKRGGGAIFDTRALDTLTQADDAATIRLGEALNALARIDPPLATLVDCKFFAGYDDIETAAVLGISDRTVRRWWLQARAWLHREMTD